MAPPHETGPAAQQSNPTDDGWDVVEPWPLGNEEVAPEEPSKTAEESEAVDDLLSIVRAEVQISSERISQEIGHLRYQLAGVLKDAAALTREHQQFRQRLIAQQREMVDKIVAPVLAERDATMGRLHAENRLLGDQLTGAIREEIAKLAEARELFEQVVVDEVAKQGEAQKVFEQTLVDQVAKQGEAQKLLERTLVDDIAKQADAQTVAEQGLAQQINQLAENQRRFEQSLVEDVAKLADEQAQFQQGLLGRQNDMVDKVVAAALAQRDVSVGRIGEENESLRRQLKGDLQEDVSQLEQRLIDRQNELVEQVAGPVRAEDDATWSRISDEIRTVRDELSSLVRDEIARLADDQQRLIVSPAEDGAQIVVALPADLDATLGQIRDETQQLRDQLLGSVVDRIEIVTDEHRQFRTRIAAAAGVAESRFAAFSKSMNARLDRIDQVGESGAEAAAPSQHLEQLGRSVAGIVDQQAKMEAALGAIGQHLERLEQQKASGPIQLDDSQFAKLRNALTMPSKKASTAPSVAKKAPARTGGGPAAAKKASKASPVTKKAPTRTGRSAAAAKNASTAPSRAKKAAGRTGRSPAAPKKRTP